MATLKKLDVTLFKNDDSIEKKLEKGIFSRKSLDAKLPKSIILEDAGITPVTKMGLDTIPGNQSQIIPEIGEQDQSHTSMFFQSKRTRKRA